MTLSKYLLFRITFACSLVVGLKQTETLTGNKNAQFKMSNYVSALLAHYIIFILFQELHKLTIVESKTFHSKIKYKIKNTI